VSPYPIADFLETVFRSLPLQYTGYDTIAVHQAARRRWWSSRKRSAPTHGRARGSRSRTSRVIRVDPDGLIVSFRDYANPVAVAEALGDALIVDTSVPE
jgi:hypothetical protein